MTIAMLVTSPVVASTGMASAGASTVETPTEPAFIVDLDDDGSARVTLAITFDLTTDSEREAFEALRANETARERRTDRSATRLQAIATRAENTTGRDMAIRNPAIAFATENDTGVVTLSATWNGLAAQEDDRVVLGEPFASGFDIDRPFRVIGPDGYELVTATPESATRHQNSATWSADTAFEGFETTFAPVENGTGTDTSDGTSGVGSPGFGIGVAVVAMLAGTAILVVRRRRHAR